jgi:hypothetical protein
MSQPLDNTPPAAPQPPGPGTKDGQGSGDHDESFTFGRRPHAHAPYPFTPTQYARLLVLRGRVGDGLVGWNDVSAAAFVGGFAEGQDAPPPPSTPTGGAFRKNLATPPRAGIAIR